MNDIGASVIARLKLRAVKERHSPSTFEKVFASFAA